MWLGLFATTLSMPLAAHQLAPPDRDDTSTLAAGIASARGPADTQSPAGLPADTSTGRGLHSLARFEQPLTAPIVVPASATAARAANEGALADKRLAVRRNNQPLLLRAVAGYRQALGFYRDAGDAENAAIVSANLLSAMLVLEGRPAAEISVAEVRTLARSALAASGMTPLARSRLLVDIGTLLLAAGARNDDTAAVDQAVAALRGGLRDAQHDGRSAREWAAAENLLGNALEFLGQTKGSRPLLDESVKAIRNAWVLYQYAGLDQYRFFFEARISALEAELVRIPGEPGTSPVRRPPAADVASLQ